MSIIRQIFLAVLVFLPLLLITHLPMAAQPTPGEELRYPGTTGQYTPYDSSIHREVQRRSQESSVLMEGPIDPTRYYLGPDDRLTLTIWTGQSVQQPLAVTPDGKLIINRVGEIDVRDKTLAEARQLVRDAVKRVYRVDDISLSLSEMRTFKVNVLGSVKYPGPVGATPASRVSEVIGLAGGGTTLASKRYVAIIRNGVRQPVDLLPYYSDGILDANPYVRGGDVIWVGVQDSRNIVSIQGSVARPGEMPFNEGDSISTLVRASYGFTADAFKDSIELVRIDGNNLAHMYVRALPDGTIEGDLPLQPGDRVYVRSRPNYRDVQRVVVAGEVVYPGSYAIEPNTTKLRDIVENAGGFTNNAAVSEARLTRRSSIELDPRFEMIRQIDPEKRTEEEVEYMRTKSLERPGVMTVDFAKLMEGSERENIALVDEDSLWVPARKDYITLSGRIKSPGNIIFQSGRNYQDYVDLAGGFGWRADESETLIIKARNGDTFLASSDDYVLEPGDQIYVPEEPEGNFWEVFTQVITVTAQLLTIIVVVTSLNSSK